MSQHLAVLRQSGLVEHRREGRNIFYQARPDGLAPLTDWLNHYRVFWPERLARLRKLLAEQNAGKGEKNEKEMNRSSSTTCLTSHQQRSGMPLPNRRCSRSG